MSGIPEHVLDDLERLLDLLALLPDPDNEENYDYWQLFAAAEQEARNPGRQDSGRMHYILSKLQGYRDVSDEWAVQSLATYCLMFFDTPSREMVGVIDRWMLPIPSGARLLESICEVAWRIYVPLEAADRQRIADRDQ